MTETGQNTAVQMPLLRKILFASDHIGLQAIQYFRQSWFLFFLVPAMGEGVARVPDVSILGLDIDARVFAASLITIGRLVDALTDPLIGWWSDRTRSRWGRRIPFILFSTPFYAIFAAMVWLLPVEGSSLWKAIYVLAILGALVGLGISGPLIDAFGFQVVGITLAVIGVVFRYISLSAVWKYAHRNTVPAKVHFWRGIRETLRNPQFVYYLPTFVMFTTGVGVLMAWIPYFVSQVLQAENEGIVSSFFFGLAIAGAVISGLIFWILINRFRFSKRRVYGGCLVASGAIFPLLGLVGVIFDGGLLAQGLVLAFIAGIPMAAVFMLPKGLTADIADYDAMLTGERREAMFYATQNFFEKVTFSLPPALLSVMLLLGETTEDPLGIRLAPVMAGAVALLGIALWGRYKLPDNVDRETVEAAGLLPSRPLREAAD